MNQAKPFRLLAAPIRPSAPGPVSKIVARSVRQSLLCSRSFVADGNLGRIHPKRKGETMGGNERAETDRQGGRQATRDRTRTHTSERDRAAQYVLLRKLPFLLCRTCLIWRIFPGLCHFRIRGKRRRTTTTTCHFGAEVRECNSRRLSQVLPAAPVVLALHCPFKKRLSCHSPFPTLPAPSIRLGLGRPPCFFVSRSSFPVSAPPAAASPPLQKRADFPGGLAN